MPARRLGQGRRASPRWTSRARTPIESRPNGRWADPHLLLVRQAADHRAGEPARPQGREDAGGQRQAAGEARRPGRRPGRVLPRRRSARASMLDGWCLKPPGFDPPRSIPSWSTSTASRPARTCVDRWGGEIYLWHRMLAQRGYVVAQRRQPGHARAARPRLAEVRLPAGRHPRPARPGRGDPGPRRALAVHRPQRASASGAGAAAAR